MTIHRHKPIDPASFVRNGKEHGHQVALFCWASQNFDKYPQLKRMYAIPNGGQRDKMVAASLKAEGVKAGVPDIFLPHARNGWHGLYIELKRPALSGKGRGYMTAEQKDWATALRSEGFLAVECVGWEAARDILIQYLEWKAI